MSDFIDENIEREDQMSQAIYNASRNQNATQKICEGVFEYLRLSCPKHEKEYWKEVYQRANASRKGWKKLLEVL